MLTVKEVCQILNVSDTTVRDWTKRKGLPCYKMQSENEKRAIIRFKRDEIDGWIKDHKVNN